MIKQAVDTDLLKSIDLNGPESKINIILRNTFFEMVFIKLKLFLKPDKKRIPSLL